MDKFQQNVLWLQGCFPSYQLKFIKSIIINYYNNMHKNMNSNHAKYTKISNKFYKTTAMYTICPYGFL